MIVNGWGVIKTSDWDKDIDIFVKLPQGKTSFTLLEDPEKQTDRFGKEILLLKTDLGRIPTSINGPITSAIVLFKRTHGDIKNRKITVERNGEGLLTKYTVISIE